MHSECYDVFHLLIYTPIVFMVSQHTFRFISQTVLTWVEAYAVQAWYVPECLYWHSENNDQNVFMRWYSMVYYFFSNTVYVFYFQRSWWGWLADVFNECESLQCRNFNHVHKLEFFFPPLYCWPVLSPKVYFVMFSLFCYVWCSKL